MNQNNSSSSSLQSTTSEKIASSHPLFIADEHQFAAAINHFKVALDGVQSCIKSIMDETPIFVDAAGNVPEDQIRRTHAKVNKAFLKYVDLPTLVELGPTTPECGTHEVAHLLYSEVAAALTRVDKQLLGLLKPITMLTLTHLANPKYPTLLDAYEHHINLKIKDATTGLEILGEEKSRVVRTRLTAVLDLLIYIFANKGLVEHTTEDGVPGVTITPAGVRTLIHLEDEEDFVLAVSEAKERLKNKLPAKGQSSIITP